MYRGWRLLEVGEIERSPDDDDLEQIMLVAGARNHLSLEFCWTAA
jgi:hypothetical protein